MQSVERIRKKLVREGSEAQSRPRKCIRQISGDKTPGDADIIYPLTGHKFPQISGHGLSNQIK